MAQKTTKIQLAPLPQGIAGDPNGLVLEINDRLRRITTAIGLGLGVESGGGSGGGGIPVPPIPPTPPTDIDAAPPVTINPPAQVIPRSNAKVEIDVPWTQGTGATAKNFIGAAVYIEDPDISSGSAAPLDGTTPLNGTAQTGGAWQPAFITNSMKSPAVVLVDAAAADRQVRIYLDAYGPNTQADPVRANAPGPTPNIVVTVPASGIGNSGMEYAFLVTNPAVVVTTDYNRPDPNYTLTLSYTPPDPTIPVPPNLSPFGAARILYVPTDTTDTTPQFSERADSGIDIPILLDAGFKTPVYTPAPQGGSFRCYFCSEDIDGNTNTLVAGVTPYALAVVPGVSVGAPPVTAFTIDGALSSYGIVKWQPSGTYVAETQFAWSIPSGNGRYAGVVLYLVKVIGATAFPAALTPQMTNVAANFQYDTANIPAAPEVWTIAAISVDANGVLADDPTKFGQAGFQSPTVIWNIGPPGPYTPGGGQEHAPFVTIDPSPTVTANPSVTPEGVAMVSFDVGTWTDPTDNRFGGAQIAMVINTDVDHPTYWSVPGTQNHFSTPAMPAFGNIGQAIPVDFYVVSDDPQGNKNSLSPGKTPKISVPGGFVPQESKVIPARAGWFDPSQFAWVDPAGGLQAHTFSAQIVQVGATLVVGGGPSTTFGGQKNGQIGVANAAGNLVAWIGTQNAGNQTTPGLYGGWFGQLWVGGTMPLNAPLFIDNQGIIEVGGIAAANGAAYPYISIRNSGGIEQGRIGAGLTTVSGTGDGVGSSPPAGLTSGAWFTQLAVGGQNLSSWHILIVPDTSGNYPGASSVTMRDINTFSISYKFNTAPTGSNYAYQFDLGRSVWMAGGLSGGAYVFPGIHLYRVDGVGNNFGATYINRGMVLRGTQPQGYPVLCSLVTYNGDSTGAENQLNFYAELTMYAPLTPYAKVFQVCSGAVSDSNAAPANNPFIALYTNAASPQVSFFADGTGVTSGQGFKIQGYGYVIDSGGHWVGQPIAGSGGGSQTPWTSDIDAATHKLSNAGAISCASLVAAGGSISGATISLSPSTSLAPAINVTLASPIAANPFLSVNGAPFCTWNGTWSGNGLQGHVNVFADQFSIFGVAAGATLGSAPGAGSTGVVLTDTNGTQHTFYIRGGLICTT